MKTTVKTKQEEIVKTPSSCNCSNSKCNCENCTCGDSCPGKGCNCGCECCK